MSSPSRQRLTSSAFPSASLAQRAFGTELVVDEDGKYLKIHTAVAELWQPPLPEELRPAMRRPSGHRHQQVVVGIGDNGTLVQVGHTAILSRGGRRQDRD
jgi:hypothetical protein